MGLWELFKNFCVALVLLQAFSAAAVCIMAAISSKLEDRTEENPKAAYHAFCALTNKPCIYADGTGNTCEDCPEATEAYFRKEKKEHESRLSGVPDERRTD